MTPDSASSGPAPRRVDHAGLVIALALAAVAAVLVWHASQLQSNTTYGMGPQAMPIVIAIGLGILAIGNLIDALRGNLPPRESADPKAVLLILAGLALLIAEADLGNPAQVRAAVGAAGGFVRADEIFAILCSVPTVPFRRDVVS